MPAFEDSVKKVPRRQAHTNNRTMRVAETDMIYSLVSSRTEVEMERIRVLLAVDSAQYAQTISSCLADQAPDFELVYFTDEEGSALDSSDVVDLLTTIAACEPDVMVHATEDSEPNFELSNWILGQFPFLPIVHVNPEGRIRRIRQSISTEEIASPAPGSSPTDSIGRLLIAIRNSTEAGPFSRAACGKVSEEPILSEAFTQIPHA
jgi:hypothetical protein